MGVDRFAWERAIRQLPIRPPVRKLVALTLATYASKDGTNAHPGEDRLATECGVTERAVRGHLAALRDELGLIDRTFTGSRSGRRGLADEYSLALPTDILARLDHRNTGSGDAPEHRNADAGVPAPITGTSVLEHRNLSADHRNLSVENTGTLVPPTVTSTKEVDHTSPRANDHAASGTGHAREPASSMNGHSFVGDPGDDCQECGRGYADRRAHPRSAA